MLIHVSLTFTILFILMYQGDRYRWNNRVLLHYCSNIVLTCGLGKVALHAHRHGAIDSIPVIQTVKTFSSSLELAWQHCLFLQKEQWLLLTLRQPVGKNLPRRSVFVLAIKVSIVPEGQAACLG